MKKLLGVIALAATLYTGALFAHAFPPPDIWDDEMPEQCVVTYIVWEWNGWIFVPYIESYFVPCE